MAKKKIPVAGYSGYEADFDQYKIPRGAFGTTRDTKRAYAAFDDGGDVKDLAFKDDVDALVDDATHAAEAVIGSAVRTDIAQSFTEAQKAQARTNINAASPDDIPSGTVRYDEYQSLTDLQKAQARVNIGTPSSGAVADQFSTATAYAVGDLVLYQTRLYRFTSAHAAGAWDASHVAEVSVSDELSDLKDDLEQIEPGLSDDAKEALLACFRNVVWGAPQYEAYINALETALDSNKYPKITADFEPGTHVVYDTDSLDSLKTYLTVTYYPTKESQGTVISSSNYTLSGTLTVGLSTIMVIYESLSTKFSVTVATHVIYSLPANTVFTRSGDNVVVTDYTTADSNKTFSIVCNGQLVVDGESLNERLSMVRSSTGTNAFLIGYSYSNRKFSVGCFGKSRTTDALPTGTGTYDFKLAISHSAGANTFYAAVKIGNLATAKGESEYNYVQDDYYSLTVGSGYLNDGPVESPDAPFNGMIREYKVLDYAMAQSEVDQYVG